MSVNLDIGVRRKPTNHKKSCKACNKELVKGDLDYYIMARGWRTAGNAHFCSQHCILRAFNNGLTKSMAIIDKIKTKIMGEEK